jgi:hypothetical protein
VDENVLISPEDITFFWEQIMCRKVNPCDKAKKGLVASCGASNSAKVRGLLPTSEKIWLAVASDPRVFEPKAVTQRVYSYVGEENDR